MQVGSKEWEEKKEAIRQLIQRKGRVLQSMEDVEIEFSQEAFSKSVAASETQSTNKYAGFGLIKALKDIIENYTEKLDKFQITDIANNNGVHFDTDSPSTSVHGALQRLKDKGVIGSERKGKRNVYFWIGEQEEKTENNNGDQSFVPTSETGITPTVPQKRQSGLHAPKLYGGGD